MYLAFFYCSIGYGRTYIPGLLHITELGGFNPQKSLCSAYDLANLAPTRREDISSIRRLMRMR